jgi:hypothetical protein
VAGLVQQIEELCAALAEFDPSLYSGADCAALAEKLARATNACETARTRAAACAAGCDRSHGAGWLARVAGCSTGAARAALETIRDVPRATLDALTVGDVSLAQAAEIASAPAHESELLDLARSSSLGVVKDTARKHRLAAIDAEELHAKQHAAQRARHWRTDLGLVHIEADLPPEVGVPIANRLDVETDRAWRVARRGGREVARDVLAADAFARMCEGGNRTRASADMVIVVDLNAYRRGRSYPGEPCHIVGGGPIPPRVARELAEDAFLKAVLHDGVNIHTVAHFGRHIPAVLRTALELGPVPDFDGVTCAESGCERRFGLEWDHDRERTDGGLTSYDNLIARCKPDHRTKTQRVRRKRRRERGP